MQTKTYIHYGCKNFDSNKFKEISNLESEKFYDIPFAYRKNKFLQKVSLCPKGCEIYKFSEIKDNIFFA